MLFSCLRSTRGYIVWRTLRSQLQERGHPSYKYTPATNAVPQTYLYTVMHLATSQWLHSLR